MTAAGRITETSYEKNLTQVTDGDVDISLFVVLLVLRWVAPYLHGENFYGYFANSDGWRFRYLADHRHHPHILLGSFDDAQGRDIVEW